MWHLPLWPFKQIDAWLRRHYEKKQLQEQIALQQKQYLADITPELDVSVRLIISPEAPKRSDIPLVHVLVKNYGGKTNITQGTFRISLPQYPTDEKKEYLSDVNMPKGKEEEFFFVVKRSTVMDVMIGHAVLKFDYDLHFNGLDGQPQERKETYTYNPKLKSFLVEK
jgi:hypothetical protein